MYTDTDIQQAIATAESKITREAYSRCLKDLYGMANHCTENILGCLLLFRFALLSWDNRAGATTNVYTTTNLSNIIRRINGF